MVKANFNTLKRDDQLLSRRETRTQDDFWHVVRLLTQWLSLNAWHVAKYHTLSREGSLPKAAPVEMPVITIHAHVFSRARIRMKTPR